MNQDITNGYALRPMSAVELFQFCDGIRKRFRAVKEAEINRRLAEISIRLLDDWTLGISQAPEGGIVLKEALARLRNRLDAVRPDRVSRDLDMSASAILFPMQSKTLVLFYHVSPLILEEWESVPGIMPYSCNAPRENEDENPPTIDEMLCRTAWTKALDGAEPWQQGMSFMLCEREIDLPRRASDLTELYPALEERLERCVVDAYICEEEQRLSKRTIQITATIAMDIRDSMNTVKGHKRLAELRNQFRLVLIRKLSTRYFTKPFDQHSIADQTELKYA